MIGHGNRNTSGNTSIKHFPKAFQIKNQLNGAQALEFFDPKLSIKHIVPFGLQLFNPPGDHDSFSTVIASIKTRSFGPPHTWLISLSSGF